MLKIKFTTRWVGRNEEWNENFGRFASQEQQIKTDEVKLLEAEWNSIYLWLLNAKLIYFMDYLVPLLSITVHYLRMHPPNRSSEKLRKSFRWELSKHGHIPFCYSPLFLNNFTDLTNDTFPFPPDQNILSWWKWLLSLMCLKRRRIGRLKENEEQEKKSFSMDNLSKGKRILSADVIDVKELNSILFYSLMRYWHF